MSARPLVEQVPVQRERDDDVGAGPDRQVQVGLPRERRRARIDHDERRAALSRASLHDTASGGCPDADGFTPQSTISCGVGIVLVGDRRHLAVERLLAAPVGAAHTVRASRDAPKRRNSIASALSCVSSPFEPP